MSDFTYCMSVAIALFQHIPVDITLEKQLSNGTLQFKQQQQTQATQN